MSLPKLLSICCLVGIVFTAPATPPSKNFSRELSLFEKDMQKEVCNESKYLSCRDQRVRKINFEVNCEPSYYQQIFCQVKNAVKELKKSVANSTFSEIQISRELLGNPANCNSTHHAEGSIYLSDFCSKVIKYVDTLNGKCL